jgi:hypothetical protein
LRAVLVRQETRIAELEREVAELRARPGMNSRNSSKLPASDPPGTLRRGASPRGRAQGHPGARREWMKADEILARRPL